MDDKAKKDFILLFNQGFEEVILPHIEELREDVGGLKKGVSSLSKRITGLEIRVGQMDNKLDIMNDKLLDHGHRIKKLERAPSVAHQIRK